MDFAPDVTLYWNFENFFSYSNPSYQIVRHLLSLTVAAFAAGLIYFAMSARQVAPRYRLASSISAVVMISAAIEIANVWLVWTQSFRFDTDLMRWVPAPETIFSNGYRYLNWSIDVPMLQTQLLVVMGLTKAVYWRNWWKLTVAGLVMVWFSYFAAFFESYRIVPDGNPLAYWANYLIATVAWLWIYWALWGIVKDARTRMSDRAARMLTQTYVVLVVSWAIYPVAIAMPAIWPSETGVVIRQVLYTTADITSKLVFGFMVGRVALLRSADEGYQMALETEDPEKVAPERFRTAEGAGNRQR
jgi:hypothetical protein